MPFKFVVKTQTTPISLCRITENANDQIKSTNTATRWKITYIHQKVEEKTRRFSFWLVQKQILRTAGVSRKPGAINSSTESLVTNLIKHTWKW